MTIPLYAMMNEFAPLPSRKGADEASPAASQEVSPGEQDESSNEESGPHGSLYEQCIPQVGKFTGKVSEGDSVAASDGARQDLAQRVQLTADVPDLKISSALGEGSLAEGYKLHEVALFDSGSFDEKSMSAGASSVATKDFAQTSPVQSSIVPALELDFSGAPEAKSA